MQRNQLTERESQLTSVLLYKRWLVVSVKMTYFVHPGREQIGLCHALQHAHVLIQVSVCQHLKSVNIQYGNVFTPLGDLIVLIILHSG